MRNKINKQLLQKFELTCTVCISVSDFLDGHAKQNKLRLLRL